MEEELSLHSLSFGVCMGESRFAMKPRVLFFDFLNKTMFVINKGCRKDAFPFSSMIGTKILSQSFIMEIKLQTTPSTIANASSKLIISFSSHYSRDFVFSLIIAFVRSRPYDDSYEQKRLQQGFLVKKGHVKWSSRYCLLVKIISLQSSLHLYSAVQLLVYKTPKDVFPVNAIELSNPAVQLDKPEAEMSNTFRIRTFFRSFYFRCACTNEFDVWRGKIEKSLETSKQARDLRMRTRKRRGTDNLLVNEDPTFLQHAYDKHDATFDILHNILKGTNVDLRTCFLEPESSEEGEEEIKHEKGWKTTIVSPKIERTKRSRSFLT